MDTKDREIARLRERLVKIEGENRELLDELAIEREAARVARQTSGRGAAPAAA